MRLQTQNTDRLTQFGTHTAMALLLAFISLGFLSQAQANFPTEQAFGPIATDGAAVSLMNDKKIVLTFDDGPSAYTIKLLNLLKKKKIKATFFIMGNKVNAKTLPVIKKIVQEGHILGSHFWQHDQVRKMDDKEFEVLYEKSIRQLVGLIKRFGGKSNQLYFRFPYGAAGKGSPSIMKRVSEKLFGENCVHNVFWSITAYDWLNSVSADDIYEIVSYQTIGYPEPKYFNKSQLTVRGGGLVLFHDGISLEEADGHVPDLRSAEQIQNTVDAVEALLTKGHKNGIRVVPLNQVEEYKFVGKKCRLK